MTSRLKVHFGDEQLGSGLVRALCGKLPTTKHATREPTDVTCARCSTLLADLPFGPSEVRDDRETFQQRELPPPSVPELTAGEEALARGIHPRKSRTRWSSVEEALTFMAAARIDGYPSGSASQAIERIERQGTIVQSGGRSLNRGTRMAEDVAQVAAALAEGFAGATFPKGIGLHEAWLIYRDRRIGRPVVTREFEGRKRAPRTHLKTDEVAAVAHRYSVTRAEVREVCTEARRVIHIALQVRGLMRVTKAHEAEVERRRNAKRRRTG